MTKQQTLKAIGKDIQKGFLEEGSGHDWWHIHRVRNTALTIAKTETKANRYIVELIALTHELGDYKLEKDLVDRQLQKVAAFLKKYGVQKKDIEHVVGAVCNLSWSKNVEQKQPLSLEGKIVQDADRLEALGAIGIARVFAYAGNKNKPIHDPRIKPLKKHTAASYRLYKNTAINHFYEKLLMLKDRMNTRMGKNIATHRHRFLEKFLQEFYWEWNGSK